MGSGDCGAAGSAGALMVGRAAQSLLSEMKGYDPVVLLGSTFILGAIALIAGFIPAHHASKVIQFEPCAANKNVVRAGISRASGTCMA